MKQFIIFSLIFFTFHLVFPQDKTIREDMVVINVEVPVRVMHKGKLVDNLKKSDFRLFENGKEITINGFHIVRKKITGQKIELESDRQQYYKPRLFVLAFSITNFNRFYEKGVRYFFNNVLRETDKLLVFVNNTTLNYNNLKEKGKVLSEILKSLNEEGKRARRNIRLSIMIVESGVRNLIPKLSSPSKIMPGDIASSEVQSFFTQYYTSWKTYKRSFLTLDIYTLYNFAAFLKRVKIEKWVISFYQYEQFPIINFKSSEGELIRKYMNSESGRIAADVGREFNASRTFPYEEVSKMFSSLGATFNLVVVPTRIETDLNATKMANISTAIEIALREITKRTGGSVAFSTNLEKTIEEIIEKEDIYYVLTYAPEDSTKRGKLKIRLITGRYKLLYDNNKRADFINRQLEKQSEKEGRVEIKSIQFLNKKLFFKIDNFGKEKIQKASVGKIKINIIIKDASGEIIFDEDKMFNPKKNSAEVLIGFNWLKPGRYDLIIDIDDLLTNHTAFEYLKLDVK